MATTFIETLRDETLRMEVGAQAVSGLAVENVELSTPDISRMVRQSIIERRLATTVPSTVVRMPGPNRLEMHEVHLPEAA